MATRRHGHMAPPMHGQRTKSSHTKRTITPRLASVGHLARPRSACTRTRTFMTEQHTAVPCAPNIGLPPPSRSCTSSSAGAGPLHNHTRAVQRPAASLKECG
eukprot:scaffold8304_cov35-Tisochrysis_lutea.AAC.1